MAKPHNKIDYNESFFEKIDNEIKAYFLGFIFADGCIHLQTKPRESKIFRIGLSIKDKSILDRLAAELELTPDRIKLVPQTNSYAIKLRSSKIYDALLHHGCRPNKTLMGVSIPEIPEELIHHFIRGYFDGDGCISKSRNKFVIQICGHGNLLEWINSEIKSDINANLYDMRNYNKGGNYFRLQSASQQFVQDFYNFIYKDATFFLERKRSIFNKP